MCHLLSRSFPCVFFIYIAFNLFLSILFSLFFSLPHSLTLSLSLSLSLLQFLTSPVLSSCTFPLFPKLHRFNIRSAKSSYPAYYIAAIEFMLQPIPSELQQQNAHIWTLSYLHVSRDHIHQGGNVTEMMRFLQIDSFSFKTTIFIGY